MTNHEYDELQTRMSRNFQEIIHTPFTEGASTPTTFHNGQEVLVACSKGWRKGTWTKPRTKWRKAKIVRLPNDDKPIDFPSKGADFEVVEFPNGTRGAFAPDHIRTASCLKGQTPKMTKYRLTKPTHKLTALGTTYALITCGNGYPGIKLLPSGEISRSHSFLMDYDLLMGRWENAIVFLFGQAALDRIPPEAKMQVWNRYTPIPPK